MNERLDRQIDAPIVGLLKGEFPDLLAVYAFGSFETAYRRTDSDRDLALLSRRAEDPVRVWDAAQAIASDIGRDVDLVDLQRASTVMAARIVSEGRRLWTGNPAACDEFEAHALADYARLNEERRAILADVQARGRVHG